MSETEYRAKLLEKIDNHFDKDELRTLCYYLDIDFDNISGDNKKSNARELVLLMARKGRLSDLVKTCKTMRPREKWEADYQAKIFLCYSRRGDPDRNLVKYLAQALLQHGHDVFTDEGIRGGTNWLENIDRQIKRADLVVILLSQESAQSEMLQAEVQRAYEYRQELGRPQILPVRINYEGMLPYSISAFINTTQYVLWQNETENIRVAEEIHKAIKMLLPDQPTIEITSSTTALLLSEDGLLTTKEAFDHPAPVFDPRFIEELEELEPPGGTIKLREKYYIERKHDVELKRQVLRPGSITTIRASRQTGKSSLLVRGVHHAKQQDRKTVLLDLQQLDKDSLINSDRFLHFLASFIVRKLHLDTSEIAKAWQGDHGPQEKLSYLMEDYILPQMKKPLVLALDEADRLLSTDFYTDFFGLMRSWHNNAAYEEVWQKLTIVMVISTEPYLLIADINQSPFNVGAKLYLTDFSAEQVRDLNKRHGSPVTKAHFTEFMQLFGGHPYLIRKALYTLVKEKPTWKDFIEMAHTDKGPFNDHLRRQLWLLRDEPDLRITLKQSVLKLPCDNEQARFRLLRAGLVKASGDVCRCRCGLYRRYFADKL